jgi:hypothetical protein
MKCGFNRGKQRTLRTRIDWFSTFVKEREMRFLALVIAAAFAFSVPAALPVKAEETTVIKKHGDYDRDRAKVVIKKKEEPRDKKVIIHKDD